MTQPALRCDLHVHSVHSGRVNLPLLRLFGNDSYSEPLPSTRRPAGAAWISSP